MRWGRLAAVTGLGVLFAVACGKEKPVPTDPDVTETPKPTFTIVLTPDSETVLPGGVINNSTGCFYWNMSVVSFVVRRNGYTGGVAVSAEAQSPMSAMSSTPQSTDSTLFGNLCFMASASASYGDYPVVLRVKAVNGDRPDVVATLTVRVRPTLDIHIPNSVTVNRGGTNTVTVALATPASAVTTTGAPVGVTIVRNGGFLDVSAAPDAMLGVATIKVNVVIGSWSDSTTIQLKVQDAPPKRAITFRPCLVNGFVTSITLKPYGIASEGEPWTEITPDADSAFRVTVTERVSFYQRAFFFHGYSYGPTLRVIHATASELETTTCPPALSGSRSVTVAVANAKDRVVTLGRARSTTSVAGNQTLTGFSAGAHDLVAAGHAANGSRVGLLQRGIDPAQGSTISLDFADASARLDSAATLLTGPGTVRLHTSNTIAPLGYTDSTHASGRYWAFPLSRLQPADVQSLQVSTKSASGVQGIMQYFREPLPLTGSLGPAVTPPVADSGAKVIRLASQPEYPDIAGVGRRIVTDGRGVYDYLEIWQTKGYAGGTPVTWTFAAPDPGRLFAMPRILGSSYSSGAVSGPFAAFFGGSPAAGTQLTWSTTQPLFGAGSFAVWLPFPSAR